MCWRQHGECERPIYPRPRCHFESGLGAGRISHSWLSAVPGSRKPSR